MSILTHCDNCSKDFHANEKFSGKRVKCPSCKAAIHIAAGTPNEAVDTEEKTTSKETTSLMSDDFKGFLVGIVVLAIAVAAFPALGKGFMLFLIVWCAAFWNAGAYVSRQCGRPWLEGAVLGVVLGPLGLIVVACLPKGE